LNPLKIVAAGKQQQHGKDTAMPAIF